MFFFKKLINSHVEPSFMDEKDIKFRQIKQAYLELEKELKESGKGLVYDTEKGIYGTSGLDNIFRFFNEIELQSYRHFLDLGSGDGRVVLIASLFTRATGIEYDAELSRIAEGIRDRLGLDCELIRGDYLEHGLSEYDVLFMNPDHCFGKLDVKLKREMRGVLFIYNEIFAPDLLKKGKKYWLGQLPVIKYTNE